MAEVAYKATDYYAPAFERTILWNDPAISIQWPVMGEVILSEKDRLGVLLGEAEVYADSTTTPSKKIFAVKGNH